MKSDASQDLQTTAESSRREFLKTPVSAGAAGVLLASGTGALARTVQQIERKNVLDEFDPDNTKIARRVSANISDDDLLLLKQLGLRWAGALFGDNNDLDFMSSTQKRFERFGIKIYGGIHSAYSNLKLQLGQPGRDQYVEQYQTFLRNLGKLGIPVASYDFHPANTYTTAHATRRGYVTREFDLSVFRKKIEKQRFDREYSAEEIWENYTYFIKAVLPVAEEAGVNMALHPDDPPVSKMNGVAKIFTHYNGYKRAEEIAGNSKNWGLEFCAGTWSEGGDKMGKDVFEMIRDFGARGKIFVVHFRNVSSTMPHFVETFPDDGYQDMYKLMATLREVRYKGVAIPDHVPEVVGDEGIHPIGTAYCITYMRTVLRRANEEIG